MDLLQSAKEYVKDSRSSRGYIAWQQKLPLAPVWKQSFALMDKVLTRATDARHAIRLISDTVLYQVNTHQVERREATIDWHLERLKRGGIDVFSMPDFVQDHELW